VDGRDALRTGCADQVITRSLGPAIPAILATPVPRVNSRSAASPRPAQGAATRDHGEMFDGAREQSRRDLRASDADRERALEFIRGHAGEGRLTVDELSDRIGLALSAKTLGELDDLVHDLPPLPAVQRAEPTARRWRTVLPTSFGWVRYAALALFLVAIAGPGAGRGVLFVPWFWIAAFFVMRSARRRRAFGSSAPRPTPAASRPAPPLEWRPPEVGDPT